MRRLGCLLLLLPALSAALYSGATGQAEVAVSDQMVVASASCMVLGLVMLVLGKGSLLGPAAAGAGCAGLALGLPGAFLVLMSQYDTAPTREIALHGMESGLYRVTDFRPTDLRIRVTVPSKFDDEEYDLVGLAAPDGTPLLLQLRPGDPLGSEVVGRVMPYYQAERFRALARRQNPQLEVPTAHILEPASLGWAGVGSVGGWVLIGLGTALFLGLLWAGPGQGE